MTDVRVTSGVSHYLIQLVTNRAKDWYFKNMEGQPAVVSNSVTLNVGDAERILRRMVKDHLIVERDYDC
jgi:hypothetical protein